MPDASSSADRAPIERLAEEFVARYRAGERPPLSEFIDHQPELAEQIKELFPTLVLMEQFKPATADHTGSFAGTPPAAVGTPLEKLGDYRILREIGRGGMGIVYEAEQMSLGRHVALKMLGGQSLLDPRQLARFEREAKAAARLHHTNIVPVYGVGSADSLNYYAMQYIAGMGLDVVLAEMRKLPQQATPSVEDVARAHSAEQVVTLPGQSSETGQRSDSGRAYWQSVARVGVQVAEALHYAHQQGILHRDIKPSNLLLDGQGTVWVTDFGLAKVHDSENLTQTGDIVGTLRYLAPERFNGQGDQRSDLYSLGLTLYELLALRPAFDAEDRNQLVRQVMEAEPPRLGTLASHLPRDLETIVHKAISREPQDRYSSGQELAADLRRFLEDRPIQARRISSVERFGRWCRRNPLVASLAGGVAAALVAVAVVSTVFAFHLSESEHQANKDKNDLEIAAQDLRNEQGKLKTAADHQAHLLGQQYVDRGVRSLNAGDYGEAALWFVEALDKDGADPDRAAVHRQRLSNTLRACPRPLHVWFHNGPVTQSAYSADGHVVATCTDRTVYLWDAETGERIAELAHDQDVLSLNFSTKGARLTIVSGNLTALKPDQTVDANVRIWDARMGKPLTPPLRHNYCWDVSPAGDCVVVSADSHSFQVWDVDAGKFLGEPIPLPDKKSLLERLQFRQNGRKVLAISGLERDVDIALWDARTGQPASDPRRLKTYSYGGGAGGGGLWRPGFGPVRLRGSLPPRSRRRGQKCRLWRWHPRRDPQWGQPI
jgi:eukaryotic-like serine/threonine-protein kinase